MLQQTFDDDDYFYFDPKNINNLNESDINQNNGFQPLGIKVIINKDNDPFEQIFNNNSSNPYANRKKMSLEDIFNLRMKNSKKSKS